ncbi:MAG: FHA domain-containing protein [bacterium]|nr:FHA domain-containing protein [bacterium]
MANPPQHVAPEDDIPTRELRRKATDGSATGELRNVALEVMEGPMDGACLAGSFDLIRIGRSADNDLALPADISVSGGHAHLIRTEESGGWRLEDRRSTNGTWVDNARVSAPHALAPGTDFMTGHSVLRFSAAEGKETFLPDGELILREMGRLGERFSLATARSYGAALTLAIREQSTFITDRHLFLGLAMMNPELPCFERRGGPITNDLLSGALARDRYWNRPSSWIHRRLQAVAVGAATLFEDDLIFTPRLVRVLLAADETAGGRPIDPPDIVEAILRHDSGQPRELLDREGIDPQSLLAMVESVPREPSPRPAAAAEPVTMPPEPVTAPPKPVTPEPVTTSGDPAVDLQAQETARKLYGTASLYHLAAPEERRLAIKQLLHRETAGLPAEQRRGLLVQLRRLFPVAAGTLAESAELTRLSHQVGYLEKKLAEGRGTFAGGGIPWRLVVEDGGAEALGSLGSLDRPRVELLREVFSFAGNSERFIVAMVHNFMVQMSSGSEVFQLPGYRTSIRKYVHSLESGEPVEIGALREYLGAVESWLIAALTAYHESPEVWFKDFWSKLSPVAIEARLSEAGWKRKLGFEALELWNHYKETARSISPDLVSDEVFHVARQRATDHFARLMERRVST